MFYKKIIYVLIPIAVLVGIVIGGATFISKSIASKSKLAAISKQETSLIKFIPKSKDLGKELERLQEYELIQDAEAAKKYASSHKCGTLPNGSTRSCNSDISDPNQEYYFSKSQSAKEIIHVLVGDFTFNANTKFKVFSNDSAEKIFRETPQILGRPLGEMYKMRGQLMLKSHANEILKRVSKEYDFHRFDTSSKEMMHQGIRYKLEGYLGVGEYNINKSIPIPALARMMVGRFVELVKPYEADIAKYVGKKKLYPWGAYKKVSFHDLVCLASDLVGEAQLHPDQQPGIAAVYWNRIAKDNPEISGLNLDATFDYGYKNSNDYDPAKKDDTEYKRKHFNWYNTYKMRIINKGAIAQVSKSAWEAILRPEKTKNIYYLHDSKGNIHYAENYGDHKSNEVKYGLSDGKHA